jgi:hypothetical protein
MGLTYFGATQELAKARDKHEGRSAGMINTKIKVSRVSPTAKWNDPDVVLALVFHSTEVVRWYPDGRTGISLGGWDTITTKRRLREYGPGVGIGTHRGSTCAWQNDSIWPGTPDDWFYTKNGNLCFENGERVPKATPVVKARPIPKSRDTLTHVLAGDAFRSPSGSTWVCVRSNEQLCLISYAGDHPDNPRCCVQGPNAPLGLSTLELLAMAERGWEAIPRFTWSSK